MILQQAQTVRTLLQSNRTVKNNRVFTGVHDNSKRTPQISMRTFLNENLILEDLSNMAASILSVVATRLQSSEHPVVPITG